MKKVLGIALGGGGAKGYFHVGALTALNESGIKFGAVSGTSIGSIVGATYALGYSPKDIYQLIKEMGIYKPSFFIRAKLRGISLQKIIENVLGERSFNDLKMPFCAVATDLDTGKEEVISSGNLCRALSASSTIPPACRYVVVNKKRLVDGGFTNLVPVNAVKNLGAKRVLAIDLGVDNPTNLNGVNLLDKIYPFHKVKRGARSLEKQFADCVFEPDLKGYSMLSVSKFDYLFEMGYEYTLKNLSYLKQKLKIKNIP